MKNLERYICPSCSSTYNAPYSLQTHLKEKHNLDVDLKDIKTLNHPIKNTKAVQEKLSKKKANFKPRKGKTCNDCGKYFTRVFNHDRHLSTCRVKNAIIDEKITAMQNVNEEQKENELAGELVYSIIEPKIELLNESEEQMETDFVAENLNELTDDLADRHEDELVLEIQSKILKSSNQRSTGTNENPSENHKKTEHKKHTKTSTKEKSDRRDDEPVLKISKSSYRIPKISNQTKVQMVSVESTEPVKHIFSG